MLDARFLIPDGKLIFSIEHQVSFKLITEFQIKAIKIEQ